MKFHTDEDKCPGCELKLRYVHPYLVDWFHRLKANYPSVHISDGWRDAAEQTIAVKGGKSNTPWPHSKHNYTVNGNACSLALDIFQIDLDGIAHWSFKFYQLIDKLNQEDKEPVLWGGTFTAIKDGPHFELILSKLPKDLGGVA